MGLGRGILNYFSNKDQKKASEYYAISIIIVISFVAVFFLFVINFLNHTQISAFLFGNENLYNLSQLLIATIFIEALYEVPIQLNEDFISIHNLDDWNEFKRLEYYILVLANSITGYLENDHTYLTETLNSLSNWASDISKSEYKLYNERPEIKGRFKLLNIQIQKTKLNIENWTKEKGLEELNKIFVFYNYSIETIKSILDDSLIN